MSYLISVFLFAFTVIGGTALSCSGCPKILQLIFAAGCMCLLIGNIVSEGRWITSLVKWLKRFKRNPNIPPYPFSKMVGPLKYNFPIRLHKPCNEVSIIEED